MATFGTALRETTLRRNGHGGAAAFGLQLVAPTCSHGCVGARLVDDGAEAPTAALLALDSAPAVGLCITELDDRLGTLARTVQIILAPMAEVQAAVALAAAGRKAVTDRPAEHRFYRWLGAAAAGLRAAVRGGASLPDQAAVEELWPPPGRPEPTPPDPVVYDWSIGENRAERAEQRRAELLEADMSADPALQKEWIALLAARSARMLATSSEPAGGAPSVRAEVRAELRRPVPRSQSDPGTGGARPPVTADEQQALKERRQRAAGILGAPSGARSPTTANERQVLELRRRRMSQLHGSSVWNPV